MKPRAAIAVAVLALALSVRLGGAGDPAEAATARKFAAIRTQPLALEAFLRQMPKGGDLHNHLSGSIYAESYLRWAADDQLCLLVTTFTIVAPPCDVSAGKPAVSAVLQNSALYNDTIDAMSMRNWPAGLNGHHHFFQAFAKFGLTSANHVGDMLAEVTARAAAEHVSYLELMVTPDGGISSRLGREAGWPAEGGTAAMTELRTKLLASGWGDVLAQTKQRLDGFEARRRDVLKCGTSEADAGCLVTVRYIAQVGRGGPREEVFAQILAGFELASSEPRVVAFNLVQPEDDPTAIRDFSLHMSMIAFLRPFYPNAHITLHAGELSDGLVPPEVLRFHIRESVRTGHASRIGHGAAAMQEDDPYGLMRELAAKKVLIEIALSSNDMILGVKGARHPLRTYLQNGVPVALVTDDYGVARSSHTLEWLKAVQEQGLDYLTVKRMVRNSIEYSFADAATKARLKQSLENAFRQFEQQETAAAPEAVIDSHCHLADEVFAADLEAVVARARDAGVECALTILAAGDDKEEAQAARLLSLWPDVRLGIGVHPHAANAFADAPGDAAVRVRQQIARMPAARAVGEIGLDYHYDFAPPDVQQQVFRAQVALACELDLPVVIHTREADDDTVSILSEPRGVRRPRGVLHCFTGGPVLARAGLELGFYISLSGIITFPKAAELRETVRAVPLDRVLIETDSPFLAPVPHRGKRNEPAYVERVAQALAEMHGLSADEVRRQTAANFHALFRP